MAFSLIGKKKKDEMPEVGLHLWNLNRISALKYIHIKNLLTLFFC